MSKDKLINSIFERILLPEHDSGELQAELKQNLSRLSEKTLGWLDNRIEVALIKKRQEEKPILPTLTPEQIADLPPILSPEELRSVCIGLIENGEWLKAVKYYRNIAHSDLRQAKEYVDNLREEHL